MRSEPAPTRKQENRRARSRRRSRRVRGPRRQKKQENRRARSRRRSRRVRGLPRQENRRTGNILRKSLTPPVLLFSARRAEAPHASCPPVPDLTTRAGGRRATQTRGAGRLRRSAETPAQRARSVRGRGASRGCGESDGPARTSESPPHTLRDLRPLRPAEGPGPRLRRNAEEGSGRRERGNFARFLMIKFISSSFGNNLAQSRNSLLSTNGQNEIYYRYATW